MMARPATVWTPDRVAKLAELWADRSLLTRDIAAYFGMTEKSIAKVRARLELPPRNHVPRGRWRKTPKPIVAALHVPKIIPLPKPPQRTMPSEIPWPTKQRMMAGR